MRVEDVARVPSPDFLNNRCNPVMFAALYELAEREAQETDISTELLMEPRDKDEILGLIRPLSMMALSHYTGAIGEHPDRATVRVDTMRSSSGAVFTNGRWHRDILFPGELQFIASNNDTTEFAHGTGIPFIADCPSAILSTLTTILINQGLLETIQSEKGAVSVFGTEHIHRRPPFSSTTPRVSIAISLFNAHKARLELAKVGPRRILYGYKKRILKSFPREVC